MITKTNIFARNLLTRNMNRFQQLLNRQLLDQLAAGYEKKIKAEASTNRAHLKSIPRHARAKWLVESGIQIERRLPENEAARRLFDYLVRETESLLSHLHHLRIRNIEFRRSFAKTTTDNQRKHIILDYAHDLGSSSRELRADAKALSRNLNDDAMNDRFARKIGEAEQRLAFALERLGEVTSRIIEIVGLGNNNDAESKQRIAKRWKVAAVQGFWNRSRVEKFVRQALVYEGDVRVRLAALKCVTNSLRPLPASVVVTLMEKATLAYFQAVALDRSLDVWLQSEAMSILQLVTPENLSSILHQRLSKPGDGDDMFVRRHAVSLLANGFQAITESAPTSESSVCPFDVLKIAAKDTSDFVRQQVAVAACHAPVDIALDCLEQLGLHDPCPKVRAATLVAMLEHGSHQALRMKLLELIHEAVANDDDEFVVRTAILMTWKCLELGNGDSDKTTSFLSKVIVPDLIRLESNAETPIRIRRWSAQVRERSWLILDKEASELRHRLTKQVESLRPGRARRIPRRWLDGFDSDTIGRVLAVMAQEDFGYDLDRDWFGYRLVRGPVFRFRFWRFWFELRHPATDKRQAFPHLHGRVSDATIRAPSQILGEQSQTKVPGEPLVIADEGNWRPFLPLVDDLISALHRNWFGLRTIRFYSSQGVTELDPPAGFGQKLWAAWRLTFRFTHFAKLRNWDDEPQNDPSAYLSAVQKLGFSIRIRPHTERTAGRVTTFPEDRLSAVHDKSVSRFFPCCAVAAIGFHDIWRWGLDYAKYFSSAFENSLNHLVIFVLVVLTFFITKHLLANIALRRARRRLPVSIGGWGTRGKSGTERLKAALIGAMGHGLVSKTTGCEAMFIQAHAFGEPLEIPLFRSYDKATIWEHVDVLKLASRLRPSAFLWECMGLTPSYVEVLSRQWTCDDLATITNAYPDHEDVQGPSGYNVATTISGFVPRDSYLLTTEQEMRPLIAESCRTVGTRLRTVGWLQSGLITDDVQARFPYKEHVDNIALVAAMGQEIGVSYEYAVKAMADFLVPDLGVLKTYPIAEVRTRRFEFTNGMSANERFACLGNWKRMGYADCDPSSNPGTWITGVVNNRADRVPRSKVFATIIVEDIKVDRFFLIGNNLSGLQGFIAEAWAERAKQRPLTIEAENWNTAEALKTLARTAQKLRLPTRCEDIQSDLRVMISASVSDTKAMDTQSVDKLIQYWESPDRLSQALMVLDVSDELVSAIRRHHESCLQSMREYLDLNEAISRATSANAENINKRFLGQSEAWFTRKFVVIENYDATGEEVVQRIVEETPPGFLNRSMGLQNIKGTGLDFVYRFQSWDACYIACEQALSGNASAAGKALQTLSAMPDFGQLCVQKVQATIAEARRAAHLQRTDYQLELNAIEQKIESEANTSSMEQDEQGHGWLNRQRQIFSWCWHAVEQYCDINDAVHRRHHADRIYKDFANGRISRQAAIEKLRKLNKRQKGGWLSSGDSF